MKFNIRTKNIELTADLQTKIDQKITSTIKRYFDDPAMRVEVMLADLFGPKSGRDKKIKIIIKLPKTKTIKIDEVSADITQAIEVAKDRLENVLERQKDKKIDKKRRISKNNLRSIAYSSINVTLWPLKATKKALRKIFKK